LKLGFKIVLKSLLILVTSEICGQDPIASFAANDTVCKTNELLLSDESENSTKYKWDFCHGNLDSVDFIQEVSDIEEASFANSIKLEYDQGNWYGFVTNRSNHKLLRLDFGADINSTPIVSDLGTLGVLSVPKNPVFIKEDGQWHGLLVNDGNSRLIRLFFGNSLGNTPTAEDLGNLGVISGPRGLSIENDNGNWIALIGNYGNSRLAIINFRASILNNPTATDIISYSDPEFSRLFGLDAIQDANNNWFALITSNGNGKVIRLDFGQDLFSNPVKSGSWNISSAIELKLAQDGFSYYATVLDRFNGLNHFNFDQDLANEPEIKATGNNGGHLNDSRGYDQIYDGIDWHGFVASRNNKLHKVIYQKSCQDVTIMSSTLTDPEGVSYLSSGKKLIKLTAYSSNGNYDSATDTIYVKNATAPTISFNTQNACIENQNSFAASSSDDPSITTWNWDFGDGTGTASGQSVEYQYDDTGTFDVCLAIDAENGCSNSASKKIHIYNPPNPSFSYTSGVTCSNSPLDFVNSTAFSGPDSLLSFEWNMNDEMLLDDSDPSYVFKTGGEKNVTLTAYIPGCNNVASELIDITPGPETAFTFQGSCEQESFTFSNATTGNGITGYRWDFGDGYTSTVPSPIHRFESAGSFPVSLTASNELGCNTTLHQVVAAQFLPVPNFTNDLACSDKEVTFYDQSSVSNANIIDRQWRLSNSSIEYSQQASGPSPTFQVEAEGQYRLRLIVESNYGCVDTLIRDDVTVNPSPTADFVFSNTCFGDETLFSEAAMLPPDTDINTVDWLINDNLFTANEVTYQFLTPGSYPVEMFVRASNFCTDNTSKTIDINPLPTLDILVTDSCESYPVSINATVDSPLDPVESYGWMIDEKLVSSLDGFSYVFDSPGTYEIALAVATRNNCTNSSTKTIDIHPIPNSGFEVFPSIGASPLNVAFTDRSSGAKSVIYDFSIYNDDVSADDNTSYIYTDVRKDWPQQIAFNDFGCTDTSFVEIEAVIPIYDIAMTRATTETGGAGLQMSFELINNGTIIINNPVVRIDLGDNASLDHPLTGRIMPGENRRFDVDFEVLNANKGIRYICFEAPTMLGAYEDVNPYDNANCVSIEQSFSVFDPYPNPSQGQFFLPIVLPETASCELSVFGEKGELVWQRNFQNAKKGLNLFQINASNYGQGVFLLNIRYEGIETTKKIVLR
jgi:PKD repeat protein